MRKLQDKSLIETKQLLFLARPPPQDVQSSIINMLRVPEIKQYEKYLGLPSFVGWSKKANLLLNYTRMPSYSKFT